MTPVTERRIWILLFILLALYVAARMGLFAPSADVATPNGVVSLPNTFASVDHPFHVARAETLWREISAGRMLRWIGQHQGGYPVEFYPLGEAWLEVAVRALSLGALSAQGAHTIAVILIFLLPGLAYLALARLDSFSPAVALLALALHVSLPGSWYDGGYTELVQWGLVTNVAGAVSALLMFPALIRFLDGGGQRAAAIAGALAAFAVYCNPRSLIGLLALGAGAWLATLWQTGGARTMEATRRLALVAIVAALLAAPELIALLRFGGLYQFVRYSGYDSLATYAATTANALGLPVLALGVAGIAIALVLRSRVAPRAAALSLLLYVAITVALAFVPFLGNAAAQLEPTRLMPLQRLLSINLAAVAVWVGLSWLTGRFPAGGKRIAPALMVAAAVAILVWQTWPLSGPPPDPANPAVPARSLYAVAMSAQPEQADLEVAISTADDAAAPGTAILVLGSALSWHQQLWAPLWTTRPLFYDNWLWYWHPLHAGTPEYQPLAGHHYPDPARALDARYFAEHGIGSVVVTGAARAAASRSPMLRSLNCGVYDSYVVNVPVTTITFGDGNAQSVAIDNQRLAARSTTPGGPAVARINWYPRWSATADGRPIELIRRNDGYMETLDGVQAGEVTFTYLVQGVDWLARALAAAGVLLLVWLAFGKPGNRSKARRWYREPEREGEFALSGDGEALEQGDLRSTPRGGR